MLSIKYTSRF